MKRAVFTILCFVLSSTTVSSPAFAREEAITRNAPLALYVSSDSQEAQPKDRRPEFRTEPEFTQANLVSYGVQYRLMESPVSPTRINVAAGVGDMKSRTVGVSLQISW